LIVSDLAAAREWLLLSPRAVAREWLLLSPRAVAREWLGTKARTAAGDLLVFMESSFRSGGPVDRPSRTFVGHRRSQQLE
jgi:hypothetical protein